MVWAEAEFGGSSRPLAVIYCYILTAAGKDLCFPLWPHNPLSALPGSRHSLHQGRACQATELGQGLPAAKKERYCIPFIVLRLVTSHAHRVLLPPQPQQCHSSGSSRSQFSSLQWSALQQCGTWNMPVWLQTAAIILSPLFWGSEHWWGVLQLTPGTTEQHRDWRGCHYRLWWQWDFDEQVWQNQRTSPIYHRGNSNSTGTRLSQGLQMKVVF